MSLSDRFYDTTMLILIAILCLLTWAIVRPTFIDGKTLNAIKQKFTEYDQKVNLAISSSNNAIKRVEMLEKQKEVKNE